MDYQGEIEKIIKKALTEKTFSLEIIDEIKKLKDGFKFNATKIELLEKEIEDKNKLITELKEKLEKSDKIIEEYNSRQKYLAEKEKKEEKIIYELEFQKQRAIEIKEMFSIVFRNPVILKSRSGNVPVAVAGQNYPISSNTQEIEREQVE